MHNILLFDFKENDICVIMWIMQIDIVFLKAKEVSGEPRQFLSMFDDSKNTIGIIYAK